MILPFFYLLKFKKLFDFFSKRNYIIKVESMSINLHIKNNFLYFFKKWSFYLLAFNYTLDKIAIILEKESFIL
jgi:hypothetical protein